MVDAWYVAVFLGVRTNPKTISEQSLNFLMPPPPVDVLNNQFLALLLDYKRTTLCKMIQRGFNQQTWDTNAHSNWDLELVLGLLIQETFFYFSAGGIRCFLLDVCVTWITLPRIANQTQISLCSDYTLSRKPGHVTKVTSMEASVNVTLVMWPMLRIFFFISIL